MVQFVHRNGCTLWGDVTTQAAFAGNLELLCYAVESGALVRCEAVRCAAYLEHWECLVYILEHCGRPTASIPVCVATATAAYSLRMLKYVLKSGYISDLHACMTGALHGQNLEAILYLRSIGAEWPWETDAPYTGTAVVDGAVDSYCTDGSFLHFLCKHGCPLTSDAVLRAAQNGQVDCLRYLLQQDCPALPVDYPAHCESYVAPGSGSGTGRSQYLY
jgi:hypothetical protein